MTFSRFKGGPSGPNEERDVSRSTFERLATEDLGQKESKVSLEKENEKECGEGEGEQRGKESSAV
jgi:hypothetical protein